jgi:hypothetical protein
MTDILQCVILVSIILQNITLLSTALPLVRCCSIKCHSAECQRAMFAEKAGIIITAQFLIALSFDLEIKLVSLAF